MRYEAPVLREPEQLYEAPMLVDLAEISASHEDGYAAEGCDGLCWTGGGTSSEGGLD